jgi:hypothetical protein
MGMGIIKHRKHISWVALAISGYIAIAINTLLLKAAPLFLITAEGGALLKLFLQTTNGILPHFSFEHTAWFALLFHFLTGFLMVIIYAVFFNKMVLAPGWIKGGLFSIFPWLINGLVVLPLLKQGIFGYIALTPAGMIWFFIANLGFGLILGWLYDLIFQRKLIQQ